MWANNETGVIFPVEEAAKLARDKGILFHTDAVQAVGKIPINMRGNTIDMLSLSGHKLHAPKGVGVLYVRKGTRFSPFLIGGHQEKGRRGGTENTASIVALGKACELAARNMEIENTKVKYLRDKLERSLLEAIPNSRVNGDSMNRLPNTTNISFEFVEGEGILLLMDQFDICASSGLSLYIGIAPAIPCSARHGSPLYHGPRLGKVQPERLQHGGGDTTSLSRNSRQSLHDYGRCRHTGKLKAQYVEYVILLLSEGKGWRSWAIGRGKREEAEGRRHKVRGRR